MKFISTILAVLFLLQACQTKQGHTNSKTPLISQCDELDIVYYTKDTFLYQTTDTATINFFEELIDSENENIDDTCEPTGQLIFRNKGKNIFVAGISSNEVRDSVSCEYVAYKIGHKGYQHRLTYRHGMLIDGIYWRKVDPKSNPSFGFDTTKFKYVDYNHHR